MAEFAPCSDYGGNKRHRQDLTGPGIHNDNTECSYTGSNSEGGRRYQVHNARQEQCTPTLRAMAGGDEHSPFFCRSRGDVITPRILFGNINRSDTGDESKSERGDNRLDYIAAYNEGVSPSSRFGAAKGGYSSGGDGYWADGPQVGTAIGKNSLCAMLASFVWRRWLSVGEDGIIRPPFYFGSVRYMLQKE